MKSYMHPRFSRMAVIFLDGSISTFYTTRKPSIYTVPKKNKSSSDKSFTVFYKAVDDIFSHNLWKSKHLKLFSVEK